MNNLLFHFERVKPHTNKKVDRTLLGLNQILFARDRIDFQID